LTLPFLLPDTSSPASPSTMPPTSDLARSLQLESCPGGSTMQGQTQALPLFKFKMTPWLCSPQKQRAPKNIQRDASHHFVGLGVAYGLCLWNSCFWLKTSQTFFFFWEKHCYSIHSLDCRLLRLLLVQCKHLKHHHVMTRSVIGMAGATVERKTRERSIPSPWNSSQLKQKETYIVQLTLSTQEQRESGKVWCETFRGGFLPLCGMRSFW